MRQATYAHSCLRLITDAKHKRQRRVVVVGHSMGGIVARAMALLPGFDDTTVSCHDFIIALPRGG